MRPPRKPRSDATQTPAAKSDGKPADAYGQLALWTSANLAGMATEVLKSREPFFRKLIARFGGEPRPHAKPTARQALELLAQAIMGSSKVAIAEVFGPPRSATIDAVLAQNMPTAFWHANTWYYALPKQGTLALAINFKEGFANRVEFFKTPVGKSA